MVLRGHHREDALGRRGLAGNARGGGLDDDGAVAHEPAHPRLVDAHHLHLAQRHLDAAAGEEPSLEAQATGGAVQAEARVAEDGARDGERVADGERDEAEPDGGARLEPREPLRHRGGRHLPEHLDAHAEGEHHRPHAPRAHAVADELRQGDGEDLVPRRRGDVGVCSRAGAGRRAMKPLTEAVGVLDREGGEHPLRAGVPRGLDAELHQPGELVEHVLDDLDVLDPRRIDDAEAAADEPRLDLELPLVEPVPEREEVHHGAADREPEEHHDQAEVHEVGEAAAHEQGEQERPGAARGAPEVGDEVDQQRGGLERAPVPRLQGGARRADRVRHRRHLAGARGCPAGRRLGPPRGRESTRPPTFRRPCTRPVATARRRARAGPGACRHAGCDPAGC